MEGRSTRTGSFKSKAYPHTLRKLAKDKYLRTKINVASNKNTPPDALDYLAKIKDIKVLLEVVRNPNTPYSALEYLIVNGEEVLIKYITGHPNFRG